jgi:psiF repeat
MMTTYSHATAAAIAVLLLCANPVFAQTATSPAAKDGSTAATEKKTSKPRSAASLECSKEADAKGLHGKERKKFRAECKRAAAEKK